MRRLYIIPILLLLSACGAVSQNAQTAVAASAAIYKGSFIAWETYAATCHAKVVAQKKPDLCSQQVITNGERLGVARNLVDTARNMVNLLPATTTIDSLTADQKKVLADASQAVANADTAVKGSAP